MPNTALTIDMITRATLAQFSTMLNFVNKCDTQFDDSFGKAGAKNGATLRIRRPAQFLGGTGSDITSSIESVVDEQETLTVATQKHVAMEFGEAERVLSFDDYEKRYIIPAARQLASLVEYNVISSVYQSVYNQVGAPGTPPTTATPFLQASQFISESGCEDLGGRNAILSYAASNAMLNAQVGYYNPAGGIGDQYKKGVLVDQWGFKIGVNPMTPRHTAPADVTGVTLNADAVDGTASMVLAGLTSGTVVHAGDVFTVADCYAIHPRTKVAYNRLQQFVVTADATAGASTCTVAVSPTPKWASTARQTVDSKPTSGKTVTFAGTASQIYDVSLAWHESAIAVAFARLGDMKSPGVEKRTIKDGNISLSLMEGYDILTQKDIIRLDVLFGKAVLTPGWCCRIAG